MHALGSDSRDVLQRYDKVRYGKMSNSRYDEMSNSRYDEMSNSCRQVREAPRCMNEMVVGRFYTVTLVNSSYANRKYGDNTDELSSKQCTEAL